MSSVISSIGFIQIMYKYLNLSKLIYIELLSIIAIIYIFIIILLLNFTNIELYKIQKVVGSVCIISTISVNAVPLLIINKVIRTHNTSLIYFPQALINSFNYACWLIYSIIKYDFYLLITNVICLCLCLFQLSVYIYIKLTVKEDSNLLVKTQQLV